MKFKKGVVSVIYHSPSFPSKIDWFSFARQCGVQVTPTDTEGSTTERVRELALKYGIPLKRRN